MRVIASSSDDDYTVVPDLTQVHPRSEARYLHLCTNNTVVGTQFHDIPKMSVPVVADMSSDFMSKPTSFDNLDLVYAHAQKNAGLAGVTTVLIRKELLDQIEKGLPEFFDYRTHIQHKSNYHTPPCFSIYITWHILRWIEKDIGGLENLGQINGQKASLLYTFLDSSLLFHCPVRESSRSQMNVVFTLPTEDMQKQFIHEAARAGIIGVAGHRKRGGCRVSIYNGVTLEAVKKMIKFMTAFENKYSV